MAVPTLLRRRELLLRGALLVGAGLLYLLGLGRSGWGNTFYAAAAQAGAQNWTAFFFGSSDAGNSITVDKPPAALWVMGLSVRLFGLSSWSLLVPEALMGVAAVALLVAAVRRVLGPGAALLAGLLFALTPVVALMFRYDNPDALMTLLLVAAAWAVLRGVVDGRTRWVVLAGALLGAAFLTKSLQAVLVVPALAGAFLHSGPGTLRRRVGQLLAGGAALAVAGGWWFAVVALIPRAHRPWVGGSSTDSPLELAWGYNGLGRLAGEASPSGRQVVSGGSAWRLFGSAGDEIGWLLPAAAIAVVAGLVLLRGRPRTDPVRASLLLWGGWAATTALVFSLMQGIWHAYYTVEMAPAVAAAVATGATLLWRRGTARALVVLALGSAVTTATAVSLLAVRRPYDPRLLAVAAAGLTALVAVAFLLRNRSRPVARAAAALLVAAAVVAPAAWSVATAARPHSGSSVSAGPGPALTRAAAPGVSASALRLLRSDADDWTWTAATVGHRAGNIGLAARAPVMPIGGFAGSDPSPSLAAFRADVAAHHVHWYVAGAHGRGPAAQIDAWVRQHAPAVRCGTTTLYDLSALSTGP